ncbi:hypothetical protein LSCM1_08200 [Leishmania martiniquensis]|uniref:EF-hand domain-containing protein n=1 Tax=Leishmania martiniquensis TaxID=1580590 RepID=A0A836HV03_9TRYP|nr:hypothetical protein LSCM1_08200 [Leishmania martiniquensis]
MRGHAHIERAGDPVASAAPVGLPSGGATPSATTSVVGFKPKTAQAPVHGTAGNGGVHDTAAASGGASHEQWKVLAGILAKLPDLDLCEMSRVKSCFSAALGEGRENIMNGLELRVVFGELGLYPSEAELNLILSAYRGRVSLVTLTQYLRLYKKELWVNRAAAAAAAAAGRSDSLQMSSVPAIQRSYKAFSSSHHMAAAREGRFAVGGGGDEDTLKAFVALGGSEDGGGEIAASTLRDAIRGFGLTIDIDALIRSVDVHHSGMLDYVDFCALWSQSASTSAELGDAGGAELAGGAEGGEEARRASGDPARVADYRRHSSFGSLMSDSHRRFLSLMANTPRRASLAAGALRRRSQVLTQQREQTSASPHARGSRRLPQSTSISGTAAACSGSVSGTGYGHSVRGVAALKASATPPTPITDEEHMTLVSMYLFPEQYESTARRVPHFAAAPHLGSVAPGAAGAGGTAGGESMPYSGALHLKSLSRPSVAGARSRSSSRQTRGVGGSLAAKKGNNGVDADGGNTLIADFFSPRNHNVYRPPSPMILSMRSTTAHRNRLKRLEQQRKARKVQLPPVAAATMAYQQQRQRLGSHATTAATRGGSDGLGDLDNVATASPSKVSTW